MFQITLDVAGLTPAERSHVVAFITDYPTQSNLPDTKISGQEMNVIPAFSFPAFEDDDEDEEIIPSPESAFGPTLVPTPPPVAVIPAPPQGLTPIYPDTAVISGISVMLDKKGLPWDERIHSSNRQFVADGTWRKRRGVDDAVFAQVEGELRAIMSIPAVPMQAAPVVPPPPPPVPIPVPTVVLPIQPTTPPIAHVPEPIIPAAPVTVTATVAVPVPPPPVSIPSTFLELIQYVTDILTKKKTTREEIESHLAAIDPLLNLGVLNKRPDLIPQAFECIRALAA